MREREGWTKEGREGDKDKGKRWRREGRKEEGKGEGRESR